MISKINQYRNSWTQNETANYTYVRMVGTHKEDAADSPKTCAWLRDFVLQPIQINIGMSFMVTGHSTNPLPELFINPSLLEVSH